MIVCNKDIKNITNWLDTLIVLAAMFMFMYAALGALEQTPLWYIVIYSFN